jgi:hypothetical protein
MKKWLCYLIVFQLLALNIAHAQQEQEEDFIKSTQNDIMLVVAAGAGGAVLGLSTLSFYDTPSKHIGNIWTGAAIGIIAGVIFVAFSSAQKSSEDLVSHVPAQEFSTLERSAWHTNKTAPSVVQMYAPLWRSSF